MASKHRNRFGDMVNEPMRMLPPISGFEKMPLVSVEEAVTFIASQVQDVVKYALEAKDSSHHSSSHDLTLDERAALRLYTMELQSKDNSLYAVLNKNLRSEDRSVLKPWFSYLKLIVTALNKIPSHSGRVYRGVKLDLSSDYRTKTDVIWWAFSSSTDTMEIIESDSFCGKYGPRTIFEIDCSSGKNISQYSAFPDENEVLLLCARQFQVISNVDRGDGLKVVHMKEIQPKYPLITGELTKSAQPFINFNPPINPQSSAQSSNKSHARNENLQKQIKDIERGSAAIIRGIELNEKDMVDVLETIIEDKKCRRIQIKESEISTESMAILGKRIARSDNLDELDLSHNHLSNANLFQLARELCQCQRQSTVVCSFCGFQRVQETELGQIKTLNLGHNHIDNEGVKYLEELLRTKTTIINLHLNHNRIGDESIRTLAKVIGNSTTKLQKLYLNNNTRITDKSIDDLVTILGLNQNLTTLWLNECNFTSSGRAKIKAAAAGKQNFFLNIERF